MEWLGQNGPVSICPDNAPGRQLGGKSAIRTIVANIGQTSIDEGLSSAPRFARRKHTTGQISDWCFWRAKLGGDFGPRPVSLRRLGNQELLDLRRRLVLDRWQYVRVSLQCERNARVSQLIGDDFHRYAGGDGQSRRRMTQVVETD